MVSSCQSLSAIYTTNAERLGLARNVSTVVLSPLFYEQKHKDLVRCIYVFTVDDDMMICTKTENSL